MGNTMVSTRALRQLPVAIAAAAAVAVLTACSGNQQTGEQTTTAGGGNVIRIGVDLPLSGGDASDGVPTAASSS